LPEGAAVPDRYSKPAFRDSGIWEIRAKKGDGFTIWRDFTKPEREAMGEIMDARYGIARTYLLMANDLANGKFFKTLAENEEWVRSKVDDGQWRNPADADQGESWVKVPDTEIAKTGGRKRYGAIAGKFIRPEIWRDINELDRMQSPGSWRSLLTTWKLNKTARNPVVHMNNIASNVLLADMVDVTAADIVAGMRSYWKKDSNYRDAVQHGAMGADMISQEIRTKYLEPLLAEIVNEGAGENDWRSSASIIGKLAKGWDALWKIDRKMQDIYRAEDDIFRMAYFMKMKRQGEDSFTAADMAREQFLDYDIRAPWVNNLRYSVFPFISYTYRAVPLIAGAMLDRPWKIAKYATIAFAINALAYWDDDDADEERERASFREEEQGYTWLGTPRMVRMPWHDRHGLPVFMDIRRWIPAGDVFDTNQGSSAIAVPAPFQVGGPLMLGAEAFLNRSSFTGDDIRGEYDTPIERFQKTGGYLLKSWLPSAPWIPGSWYWDRISNAMRGATDARGNPYSVPQAILSSVGVKVRPQDVEQGLYWRGVELSKEGGALKSQARALARKRERNLVSQDSYEEGLAVIVLKAERLKQRADYLSEVSRR